MGFDTVISGMMVVVVVMSGMLPWRDPRGEGHNLDRSL